VGFLLGITADLIRSPISHSVLYGQARGNSNAVSLLLVTIFIESDEMISMLFACKFCYKQQLFTCVVRVADFFEDAKGVQSSPKQRKPNK